MIVALSGMIILLFVLVGIQLSISRKKHKEKVINRLRNELAIADTAKIAYVNALKRELESPEEKGSKETKGKDKK